MTTGQVYQARDRVTGRLFQVLVNPDGTFDQPQISPHTGYAVHFDVIGPVAPVAVPESESKPGDDPEGEAQKISSEALALAAVLGVDISNLPDGFKGTGAGGQIVRADIEAYFAQRWISDNEPGGEVS